MLLKSDRVKFPSRKKLKVDFKILKCGNYHVFRKTDLE
ncbi:hypothetical protein LEP1GSC008_3950 [Leptospira kirschneri serovar Bulgarica str. Nikolaevo]|uniref:Uncharacterized protein n=1 Tax=Leptospira kirschneri serovar Bulgarica str. Nikolaevo TaxID=1240687 RepID=M6FNY6_9LEPT|nr:hypothetical protein LEP1GSC008_3950 [Leptospira kirschneri serovar Bulgarica str. Nikolaevo]